MERRLTMLAAGLIVLAAVAAYYNSFAGVFVYDDITSIVENQTIRQLWPIGQVFSPPPGGVTVTGRPLLNLTLAINYALGGLNVRGYHAANLAVHIAAGLLLFGILRRTFLTPKLRERFGGAATPLALVSALIWTVHPLQTESVTYIVQRAESLAGCFYLLTLYCVIRGAGERSAGLRPARADAGETPALHGKGEKGNGPPRPISWFWYAAAVLACLLGMATKEVMVTVPLIVLLYDRTFLAGSFVRAWRRRWGLYMALAATWALLGYLVFSAGLIGHQSEMGAPDAWSYARSQPGVILQYLWLSIWPHPLCFDYAWPVVSTFTEIAPGVVVVGALLAATIWGLIGRKAWGFLGAWFFLILAPTSSVMPLRQLAIDHRVYLSLAAIVVLAVAAGYCLCDKMLPRRAELGYRTLFMRWVAPLALVSAVLLALGYATIARNSVYRSLLTFWQDAIGKCPGSAVAQNNLGATLGSLGRTGEAIQRCEEALRLKPTYTEAYNNLGLLLAAVGRIDEAVKSYDRALGLRPDHASTHNNLGIALVALGKTSAAIEHYQEALRLKPDLVAAHYNIASLLLSSGRIDDAIDHYREVVRLMPDEANAHNNLAIGLAATGKSDEAIVHYRRVLQLKPEHVEAHNNLGRALADIGKIDEAIEHFSQAIRLKPNFTVALNNLAWLLASHESREGGDPARAVQLAERARELAGPQNIPCLDTLAAAYAAAGRFDDAVATAEKAMQLANSAGQTALAQRIQSRLELYRAGRPYREAAPPSGRSGP